MYPAHIITVLLLVGSVASTDANTTVGPDDNVRSDAAHGPHAPSDLSDEVNMMQGGMRVSRTSNLEVVVQKAVQEAMSAQRDQIAAVEKAFFQRAEELKQKNDELFKRNAELSRSNEQMREKLDKQDMKHDQLFKRNEELSRSNEQIHEKLNQQEMKHEQLRKDHRLSYGMLLQICDKGLRGLAGTSKKRANVTDVARGNKQKFAPDVVDTVVDGTVDAANTVAEGTVDAANAVADVATDAFDTIADLPGDVADWTLEQLENLKSLIGLSWDDIPGLKDVINGVKDFAVDTVNAAVDPIMSIIDAIEDAIDEIENAVNTALDTVKDWVSILEEELKKVTDYVADLYNKYLKPIITMIWDCAKNAKTPIDFVVCVIKPVLEKLLQSLIPTESVDMVIPFPFDDEALQIDPESGVYTMQQPCTDCQEGDMRDLAPLRCQKKEFDFMSIFKLTAHACNVPFMPGQCGGSLTSCVKKKASQCATGALLWGSSGVLSKLSAPIEQALQLSLTCLQKISYWISTARALHEKAKTFMTSSEAAVQDVLSKFTSALDNAQDTKDGVVKCLKNVGQITSARSLSKMVKKVEDIITSVEELIGAIERTQASLEDLETSFNSLSSSTEAEVQEFYTQGTSDVLALKSDIDKVKNDLMELYQNSKGVAEELLEDFQAALATPVDQLEDLSNFLLKCATARESYQKVYVDLEVASMTAGRLLLHERDGIKLAYIKPNFGRAQLYHEEWPWSSLETKTGQKVELCVFVYCVTFKIKVRKNPSNILGLPIQVSDGLDDLKWFELEYEGMFYDLNVIGVPYKFDDPTGLRFPSITIPILLDTSAGAQNPSTNPSDASNTLWHLVDENKAEAQQIADGLATAPGLPASAASGNDINTIKAEVDEGLHMEESSIEISDLPGLEISALPWGLQDGDIIAVQAAGHHSNTYLGLCPLSGGTCDGNTHKAFAMTEPSYWQVVLDTSTTFYLRKPDQDNAYLGLCGISNAGCDNDQYGVYGYPTKRDRAKWEFEIDAGNVAYLKASGHHGAAPYVGFCGNYESCGSSKYGSFSYTKVSRARFQIEKIDLPLGLKNGDTITIKAAGHHGNAYLGLCPISGGTCDGATHKAYGFGDQTTWQIESMGTTFYLRSQDNAYLGLCGMSNAGCDNDQYNVYGYSTKKDRTKWEFEIDSGNVVYLKASGHHGAAPYVGFCGNFASCGSSKYGSFSYTKVSRTRFQIDKV